MTPPLKYLATCPVCGRKHTSSQSHALYCDAECKIKAFKKDLVKTKAVINPEWDEWQAAKRKEQIYRHRKEVVMGTPFEPVFVPDSKGQADFHSGLMV